MFKCDCCGECCRHIAGIIPLEPFDDRKGVCRFLDREKNLCSIYASRPLVCNVDAMYETFFADKMSREEFYLANHEVCEKLKASGKNL